MNKLIYLLPYWLIKIFLELLSLNYLNIQTRNSIHFNYFKLFKSDLDITIYTKATYPNQISNIAEKTLKILPFIKEVNHFYFENQKYIALLNIYEGARQNSFKKINSTVSSQTEIYIFLLRMLQSNLKRLNSSSLNDHDSKKWNFYFELTNIQNKSIKSREDILNGVNSVKANLSKALTNILDILNNYQLTTREKFHALEYKREAKILFPHIFSSIKFEFNFENTEEEKLYISQISWEVFGLSTQIFNLKSNIETIKHLKNLESQLHSYNFKSEEVIKKSKLILQLIKSINNYLLLE